MFCVFADIKLNSLLCLPLPLILPPLPIHPPTTTAQQLHDELVFEVSTSHLAPVLTLIRRVMEGTAAVWGIQLPMPVKIGVGPSWGQLSRHEAAAATQTTRRTQQQQQPSEQRQVQQPQAQEQPQEQPQAQQQQQE